MTPASVIGGSWTEAVLYGFTGGSDGAIPNAGVVVGPSGVLYGTTSSGGTANSGTVFSLTPPIAAGGSWTEAVLYSFSGSDGANPSAPVVVGSDGMLYGTTYAGGTANSGIVYKLTPPSAGGGGWTETVLYNFAGPPDGANPVGAIAIGRSGTRLAIYGETASGGASRKGTVFSLTEPSPSNNAWTEAVLHGFTGSAAGGDGSLPEGGVVIGPGGILHGTTYYGGAHGFGTVFSMVPPRSPGGQWTEFVLYRMGSGSSFCTFPDAPVVIGSDGLLYGTTYGFLDAAQYWGTVFSLQP